MESWKADEKHSSRVVKTEVRRWNSAKVRRKKIHPRQMLEKSRNAVFFQWSVCPVSRKVGLLKRRVRSHVVRGEIKNCMPLWRKAHFEVKMYKTPQVRSTFWSSDVEKSRAAVAKSAFQSENVQNTSGPKHFWKFRCRKIVEKLHAAVARSTFPSAKKLTVSEHFWKFWCRKIARCCSAKHSCKWTCTKYLCFGTLFEVQMSKSVS